jgi:hypothetical protein
MVAGCWALSGAEVLVPAPGTWHPELQTILLMIRFFFPDAQKLYFR